MKTELSMREYLESCLNDDNKQLERNAENLMQVFLDAVDHDSISQLWEELKEEPLKFEALSNYLEISENKEKQRVYYYAVMRSVIMLTEGLKKKSELQKDMNIYAGYRHLFPVLEMLYQHDTLSRSRLRENLGISSNSLSNFMSRTRDFGLWTSEKEGKNCYYRITFKGKNVYKGFKKDKIMKDKNGFDQFVIVLLDDIMKELEKPQPDTDEIILDLDRRFGKCALMSSAALKFKLRTFFMRQNLAARKKLEMSGQKFQRADRWGSYEVFLSEPAPHSGWGRQDTDAECWQLIMEEQEEYEINER